MSVALGARVGLSLPRRNHRAVLPRFRRHLLADRREVEGFQLRALREILAHAYARVPHYRGLFERAGVRPDDIRTVGDLAALPTTSKEELRCVAAEDLLERGADRSRLLPCRTSGSSGPRFHFWRWPIESSLLRLFIARAESVYGLRRDDRLVNLLGSFPQLERPPDLLERLRQALGLYRIHRVDCLQPVERIVEEISRLRPTVLTGYPSALGHLAAALDGCPNAAIRPRFVVSSGESLALPMRRRIEATFGAPLFDLYATLELRLLAWECPTAGCYHVCDDSVVVELVRDGRPVAVGERGEVVVTGLHGYGMPFIRYRQGDLATRGPDVCPCGAPFSTLTAIAGRTLEYYRLPGGRSVHHFEVSRPLLELASEWTVRYQIFQESETRIRLTLVPSREIAHDELEAVRRHGQRVLGPGVDFEVRLADRIEPDASGKVQASRSALRQTGERNR